MSAIIKAHPRVAQGASNRVARLLRAAAIVLRTHVELENCPSESECRAIALQVLQQAQLTLREAMGRRDQLKALDYTLYSLIACAAHCVAGAPIDTHGTCSCPEADLIDAAIEIAKELQQ